MFLFTYVIGGNIYDNSGKYQFMGVSKKNWNFREDFYDRWTKPGDVARYPRLTTDATNYPGLPSEDQFNSTMFLHDASSELNGVIAVRGILDASQGSTAEPFALFSCRNAQ